VLKATVRAGVCGFCTSIMAASEDAQHVHLEIESDCEKIKLLAEDFPLVDGFQEISDGFDGVIHQKVRTILRGCCSGCIVPSGLFKAMQVAAGLALPVNADIQFEHDGRPK
jgi:hypothetical protein